MRNKGVHLFWRGAIAAALFAAVLGAGCSRAASTNTATDSGASSSVVLANTDAPPKALRVISAAPSNTDIVAGLGMGACLVAVDRYSQGIPGVPAGLPEIDFFYPDTEAVIALEPDLILVNEVNSGGVADNPFKLLEDMGIRVVMVPSSQSLAEIYDDIILIAGELGVPGAGEAMVSSMKEEVERIAAPNRGRAGRTVYFEVAGAPSIVTFGGDAYLSEMIEIAGGKNIFADMGSWFSPAAEEIINRNPEVIFFMKYPGEDPLAELMSRPGFENIAAVREKRVYSVDADSAARPSQNILSALREMAHALSAP